MKNSAHGETCRTMRTLALWNTGLQFHRASVSVVKGIRMSHAEARLPGGGQARRARSKEFSTKSTPNSANSVSLW
jgi:hypothetical protein